MSMDVLSESGSSGEMRAEEIPIQGLPWQI